MLALRVLILSWLGSAVVHGHSVENGVAASAAAVLTSVPEPTGQIETPEAGDQEHDRQISIASAAATAARWHWLELIRRQKASQNETDTTTQTRTKTRTNNLPPSTPPTTPPTSKKTKTKTKTKTPTSIPISSSSIFTSSTFPIASSSSKPKPSPTIPTPSSSSSSSSSVSSIFQNTTSSSKHFHRPSPQTTPSATPTSKTVVRTTTLPDGDKSTFTSIRVMTPPADAAAQATNTEGAPSLQSGAADSIHGGLSGRDAVALIGGVFGVAYLL